MKDESSTGAMSHGNRVMAGKEFKFLHKLEIKDKFNKLGVFNYHEN